MSRKITIYSTKTKATQEITTPVNTWGELKPLVNSEMGVGNAKCMIRETRNTLENNEAQLPTGDFTVFVYPEKVKSGGTAKEGDAYASLSDADLRKACNRKSLVSNGPGHVMRSKLRAYDKRHGFDGPKAHLSVKKGTKPTTIKKKKVASKEFKKFPPVAMNHETITGDTRGSGSPTTAKHDAVIDAPAVCPGPNYEREAQEIKADIYATAEALVPNTEVNIRDVVKVMRNKFLNMFDELLDDIDSGDIKRDVEVLNSEAEAIAQEMGITLT